MCLAHSCTRFVQSTGNKKSLTMDPCAIFYGPILTVRLQNSFSPITPSHTYIYTSKTYQDGVSLLAVLGSYLVPTSQKPLHTTMPSTSLLEHINSPWMDSSSCLIRQLSQFGVLPITVTGEPFLFTSRSTTHNGQVRQRSIYS